MGRKDEIKPAANLEIKSKVYFMVIICCDRHKKKTPHFYDRKSCQRGVIQEFQSTTAILTRDGKGNYDMWNFK